LKAPWAGCCTALFKGKKYNNNKEKIASFCFQKRKALFMRVKQAQAAEVYACASSLTQQKPQLAARPKFYICYS